MAQRYATLGALMFLAILSNIWVITISLSFTCTWMDYLFDDGCRTDTADLGST